MLFVSLLNSDPSCAEGHFCYIVFGNFILDSSCSHKIKLIEMFVRSCRTDTGTGASRSTIPMKAEPKQSLMESEHLVMPSNGSSCKVRPERMEPSIFKASSASLTREHLPLSLEQLACFEERMSKDVPVPLSKPQSTVKRMTPTHLPFASVSQLENAQFKEMAQVSAQLCESMMNIAN